MKYTEEELKMWFDKMIEKYPHSMMTEHLRAVRDAMFDDIFESNNLENVVKNFREGVDNPGKL